MNLFLITHNFPLFVIVKAFQMLGPFRRKVHLYQDLVEPALEFGLVRHWPARPGPLPHWSDGVDGGAAVDPAHPRVVRALPAAHLVTGVDAVPQMNDVKGGSEN